LKLNLVMLTLSLVMLTSFWDIFFARHGWFDRLRLRIITPISSYVNLALHNIASIILVSHATITSCSITIIYNTMVSCACGEEKLTLREC
jgi:hypothetical protein